MFNIKILIILGILLVLIGAFFKVLKYNYSNIIIFIGLGLEILALILFLNSKKSKIK